MTIAEIEFNNPKFLFLLIPYFLMLGWYLFRKLHKRGAAIAISSEEVVNKRKSLRVLTYRVVPILRFLSILFLILALSRPGRGINYSSVKNLGIDIMIALDLSGSMGQEDFEPKNRLTVAKQVLKDFVSKRKSDRIGLIIFGSEAYLQCPLTIEHQMIHDIVDEIDFTTVDHRRTAIGDAVALATAGMMESKTKSKIVLLLTDGANNSGTIDPETAAKACAEQEIKVYTVGIGKKRYMAKGPLGISIPVESDLDIETLQNISKLTGGKFFHATTAGVLWKNIKDIDRMEKSEVELRIYHEFYDKFEYFLFIAVGLFFSEIILRSVFFRKIP
ncbi:MAG: VWA domain-containing protein [bacterium]|nr:VWA domain-containing protein [bacterium]